MMALRHTVFGLGGLQVLISCVVIFAVAIAAGVSGEEAIVIAGALSLSSTAVVSKELASRNELHKPHGQLSIGILLFYLNVYIYLIKLANALHFLLTIHFDRHSAIDLKLTQSSINKNET